MCSEAPDCQNGRGKGGVPEWLWGVRADRKCLISNPVGFTDTRSAESDVKTAAGEQIVTDVDIGRRAEACPHCVVTCELSGAACPRPLEPVVRTSRF